ncbi:MAG: hypothetical protein AABX05_00760 [Nanoarchaeota archaeon]|mgnify:FL=1
MPDKLLEKAKEAKKSLYEAYSSLVEAKGFSMAHGIGFDGENYTLEVRLQPKKGVTIDDLLIEEVKTNILPREHEGYQVMVQYLGQVTPRKS